MIRSVGVRSSGVRGALVLVLGLGALAGCDTTTSTTTTTTVPTVTGLIVRAASIVGDRGCGRGGAEVFKYAALVEDPSGALLGAGVYDCFADAIFVNEGGAPAGVSTFTVRVFVYTQATWAAHAADVLGALGDAAAVGRVGADWTTTCTATQEQEVEVLAVCAPLAPSSTTP